MGSVGIKELKDRLTYYLRLTKQGEEIGVTERGKPIALLQPLQSATQIQSQEARLAQLAAQGVVTLPTSKPLSRLRRVKAKGTPVSQLVLEERR